MQELLRDRLRLGKAEVAASKGEVLSEELPVSATSLGAYTQLWHADALADSYEAAALRKQALQALCYSAATARAESQASASRLQSHPSRLPQRCSSARSGARPKMVSGRTRTATSCEHGELAFVSGGGGGAVHRRPPRAPTARRRETAPAAPYLYARTPTAAAAETDQHGSGGLLGARARTRPSAGLPSKLHTSPARETPTARRRVSLSGATRTAQGTPRYMSATRSWAAAVDQPRRGTAAGELGRHRTPQRRPGYTAPVRAALSETLLAKDTSADTMAAEPTGQNEAVKASEQLGSEDLDLGHSKVAVGVSKSFNAQCEPDDRYIAAGWGRHKRTVVR